MITGTLFTAIDLSVVVLKNEGREFVVLIAVVANANAITP